MNNGLRNVLVGAVVTIMISFIGAWIQVNNRISVLEVQMDNYVKVQQRNDESISDMVGKLNDIQMKVTKLNVEFEIIHKTDRKN